MKAQAPSIIDIGRPSEPFIDSLWLQETFTESSIPASELRIHHVPHVSFRVYVI